jgi:hypothetical protein
MASAITSDRPDEQDRRVLTRVSSTPARVVTAQVVTRIPFPQPANPLTLAGESPAVNSV